MTTLDGHRLHRDLTQSTGTDEVTSLRTLDTPATATHSHNADQYATHTGNKSISANTTPTISSSLRESYQGDNVGFYSLQALDIMGNNLDFSSLKGKIVLIVNVATGCYAAHQLEGLEKIHQRFKNDGVVVLAFPSNQFHQERSQIPEEIVDKCERKWSITFPLMQKVRVNGSKQHEVFSYLKEKKRGWMKTKRVKWNYEKFLVDREGNVTHRFSTLTRPDKIEDQIADILEIERKNARKRSVTKSQIFHAENQTVIYI
ncbi:Glutathione peroxidase 2 [Cyberlindnera fabianii]|uniref:Glutathione peroxidase n=1 Tax=Cyberlindnera fabianii TaxID=36022 RepID=A0A1V2L6U2_CYBFA|nr:Glutathione peroxidase 2 [Cyberlindnera fabianii]